MSGMLRGTGRSVSLQLVLACWAAGFSAPDGWAQEAGRSLEKAVQELNRSAAEDKVGKTQPRLTTDEVVAAIRGWQRDKVEAADEVYDAYQRIADTLRLPAGARLRYMTTLRAFSNHRFDVWWVHFCIPTGKQAVYAFPIRRRMLRCYPLRTRDAAPVRVENARSVTGAFLAAVRKGDYRAAITLSRPGEFSAEGLAKLKRMFALEQAAIDRAWADSETGCAVTCWIPITEGKWDGCSLGFGLIRNGTRWIIRDLDLLPNEKAIKKFVGGFRKVAPDAREIAQ